MPYVWLFGNVYLGMHDYVVWTVYWNIACMVLVCLFWYLKAMPFNEPCEDSYIIEDLYHLIRR